MRGVGIAEHLLAADDLDARRRQRHQDLRLLVMRRVVLAAGADHADHDLAARAARPGDVVLLAVDDVLVADQGRAGVDVLGVGAGGVQLGHAVGRADLSFQQRLQPLLLLLRRAHPFQHFHVAGVGRRAVHDLGGEAHLAQFDGDVGVVEVRQALARLGVRQEEVPEARGLGLVLGGFQHFELAGGVLPRVGAAFAQAVPFLGGGFGDVFDERLDGVVERQRLVGHAQVVEFVLRIQLEPGLGLGVSGARPVGGHGHRTSSKGALEKALAHTRRSNKRFKSVAASAVKGRTAQPYSE